jgi:hypothetical protein
MMKGVSIIRREKSGFARGLPRGALRPHPRPLSFFYVRYRCPVLISLG